MAVMSFAHLRDKKVGVELAKPEPASYIYEDKSNSSALEEKHTSTSGIMSSKFCYGCTKFQVDAPDTKEEAGWCQRDMVDDSGAKYFEFRMIPNHAAVRQCPRVKSGDIILRKM